MAEDVAEGRVADPKKTPEKAPDAQEGDPKEGDDLEDPGRVTDEEEEEPEEEPEGDEEEGEEEEGEEGEESDDDFVQTFDELAEGLDQEPEALLKHLTVKTPAGEQLSLADVIEAYQNPTSPVIQAKVQELETAAATRVDDHQQALQEMALATEQIITLLNTDPELSDEALEQLHQEDPSQWAVKVAERDQKKRVANEAMDVMRKRVDKEVSERAVARKEWKANEIVQAKAHIPEWFGEDDSPTPTARKEGAILQKYLVGIGFEGDDFSLLDDHRFLRVAREASLAAVKKGKVKLNLKKVRETSKANLKPGARRSRSRDSHRTIRAERAALKKSGSLDDAARVLGRLLR